MKRRKKSNNLGGTKTEHLLAANAHIRRSQDHLALIHHGESCRRQHAHLAAARGDYWKAQAESGWVGHVTTVDSRMKEKLAQLEQDVHSETRRFVVDCVKDK